MSPDPPGAGTAPGALERVIGAFLVGVATVLVTLAEGFLVGLRVGTVRVPVSIAGALVLHPLFTLLMRAATRSNVAMFGPAVIWALTVWPLTARRAEGDLIITGDGWNIGWLLSGAAAFAVTLGLLLPSAPAARGSLGGNGPG